MSSEFEKIKSEIMQFRRFTENEKQLEQLEIETDIQRIERDKLFLQESGAIQLFVEIRDAELVKWTINDPAKIFLEDPDPNPNNPKAVIAVLQYNYRKSRDSHEHDTCSTVGISVLNSELYIHLLTRDHSRIEKHRISSRKLADSIVKSIKNPISTNLSPDNTPNTYIYK